MCDKKIFPFWFSHHFISGFLCTALFPGWSSFLMLDVKEDKDTKVQKIYLLDSAGTIVINTYYFGHDSVRKDTALEKP